MSDVSIDPGVRDAGVALWDDDHELRAAKLIRCRHGGWPALAAMVADWVEHSYLDIQHIVIEQPQVYVQSRQKGNPNYLIALAMAAGAIAMAVLDRHPDASIVTVLPAVWKGNTPKDIHNERTKKLISPVEHEQISLPSAKSLQHNVWDAVGIGLHLLQRKRGKR